MSSVGSTFFYFVFIENNEVVTDSVLVAVFEKRHDNVVRDIKSLEKQSPQNSGDYFIETTYKDKRNRTYRKYNLTKEGFTLLVMGFTGKKALQFKKMYINEFNRMKEELKKH
ncbi:UNVERIFIED_CONTAM: Rha family transcriptional regulator [Bacillus mycoides]|nr:Rha family transcriptional regulator [Bacillus mycoides]